MKNVLFVLSCCLFLGGTATVSAQTDFVDYQNNPVLSYSGQSGTFDQMRVYAPQVVEVDGVYWMYYTGIPNGNFSQIGLAKSIDGKNWSRYSLQPVFRCGENTLENCVNGGLWSSTRVVTVSVMYEDGIFKMWYLGNNKNLNAVHRLGYATSEDGINWTVHPENPVFDGLVSTIIYQSVVHVGDVYRLYFYNSNDNNLYAVDSADGIDWTEEPVIVKNQYLHSIGYLNGLYYAMSEGNIYFSADGLNFDTTEADLTIANNSAAIDFGVVGDQVYAWRTTNYGNIIWSFANVSIDLAYIDKNLFFGSSVPENPYPLYTQIESPYPSLLETAQWADEEYANGRGLLGEYPCGATIGDCGCAITSLVMAARNAGIEEDVLGDDVNPGNMNAYLEGVGGYDSVGSLYWLAAQVYFGEFTTEGIASRFATPVKRPGSEGVMSFVDTSLVDSKNAVLAYKNGHFVWLPVKTTDGYLVNDPWWYNTKTADDTSDEYIRDYNNTFSDARVFAIADEPVLLSGGGVEAHVRGTAELLFTKATGEQVGYLDNAVVVDLENASYSGTEIISVEGATGSDGKTLLVYDAGNEFTIEVMGTEFGEFTAEFFTVSESGNIETFELSGQTIPGVATTFTINLETGEVTEEPISYEQFLAILEMTMEGYTDQQRKFFLKWAEKIYENMEEKTVSQALQGIEVYKKLLVAKKVESPVLSSVLELLVEDVRGS